MKNYEGRKTWFPHPRFQAALLFWMCAGVWGAIALVAVIDHYALGELMKEAQLLGFPRTHVLFQLLDAYQTKRLGIYLGAVGAGSLLTFGTGWWVSHRVGGPIVRLRGHIDRVAQGLTVGDVQFREDDYFQDLARAYNQQMFRMREDHALAQEVKRQPTPASAIIEGKLVTQEESSTSNKSRKIRSVA